MTTYTQPTAQVIGLGELQGDLGARARNTEGHGASPAPLVLEGNPLLAVRTTLQVCVGEVQMTVGDLLAATEHQVLVLDRTVEQPVDLTLEGKVVARGQLVAVDGRFALRITELPAPLGMK
ncbi:FliM/FliN family flagellar motor switch protein [Caenimonas koreensis]|uniref:Flagellar motor switch protein FliN n=1 Tax=Caenimonas koreensis DSM 17982 TaxID=1121255 RepID=A0A844BB50_9BURK|nr:FliM/FliN family flagellar motor switch protein [Caenimonas koreensis]MRD48677.1 flagellar motor switch protein [Caenimonas koreensis DSM 17982]